jgi:hypothetical protein
MSYIKVKATTRYRSSVLTWVGCICRKLAGLALLSRDPRENLLARSKPMRRSPDTPINR